MLLSFCHLIKQDKTTICLIFYYFLDREPPTVVPRTSLIDSQLSASSSKASTATTNPPRIKATANPPRIKATTNPPRIKATTNPARIKEGQKFSNF